MNLPPNSELARIIAELDHLAAAAAAKGPIDKRGFEAFPLLDQPARIAVALEALKTIKVPADKLRSLRKRVDRLATFDFKGQAQDTLLELEVAGRLAQAGLQVEFAEPDIVVHFDGVTVSLACKRPRTIKGVTKRLEEAAAQIDHCDRPGIIALSLETLLHSRPGLDRPVVWVAPTLEDLARDGRRELQALAEKLTPDGDRVGQRFAKVMGVLWLGVVSGYVKVPPSFVRNWYCLSMENALYEGDYGPLRRVARSLFAAGPK